MLIPLSTAIMHSCILSTVSPSRGHFAYSFRALFLRTCLLAGMYTKRFPTSHLIPSSLKSNYFPLAFLVSIFLLSSIEFCFEYSFTGKLNQIKWALHFVLKLLSSLSSWGLPRIPKFGICTEKLFLLHPPSSITSVTLLASLSVTELLKAACGGGGREELDGQSQSHEGQHGAVS